MQNRYRHEEEVLSFLQRWLPGRRWGLVPPRWGRGRETYVATGGGESYFVKLGVRLEPYLAMSAADLTPPVLRSESLTDGTTILIQPYLSARTPSWGDFAFLLDDFAAVVRQMQHDPQVQDAIAHATSPNYRDMAVAAYDRLTARWLSNRDRLPRNATERVDNALAGLWEQVQEISGSGVVAAHNDICNANWLITAAGKIYLVDLDEMAMDDPAQDLGALLWWYYPPELRASFLKATGWRADERLAGRMRVRMAMHCLSILLPREHSFDELDPAAFPHRLVDLEAVLAGVENPRGYGD
jgi:hypothetical protein